MKMLRHLAAACAALSLFALAQSAGAVAIFNETFDDGALDNPANWTITSSRPWGRVAFDAYPSTAAGTGAMWMDSTSGNNALNEAILTLDLSSCVACTLGFAYAETADESHFMPASFSGSFNGDGVAISADGVNWYTVLNSPATSSGVWVSETIDLAAEAAGVGLALGPDFRIKFQQYDNLYRTQDGRGYDEIVIDSVSVPAPGTLALLAVGLLGLIRGRR